jgi:ABC-type multidrug transport system fused ATPase/permease subunit
MTREGLICLLSGAIVTSIIAIVFAISFVIFCFKMTRLIRKNLPHSKYTKHLYGSMIAMFVSSVFSGIFNVLKYKIIGNLFSATSFISQIVYFFMLYFSVKQLCNKK